jgi:hypothetical protein
LASLRSPRRRAGNTRATTYTTPKSGSTPENFSAAGFAAKSRTATETTGAASTSCGPVADGPAGTTWRDAETVGLAAFDHHQFIDPVRDHHCAVGIHDAQGSA